MSRMCRLRSVLLVRVFLKTAIQKIPAAGQTFQKSQTKISAKNKSLENPSFWSKRSLSSFC